MTQTRFTAADAVELSKQAAILILDEQEKENYQTIIDGIIECAENGWFSLTIWNDEELHDKLSARVTSILKRDGFNVIDSYTDGEDDEHEYVGKIISWKV